MTFLISPSSSPKEGAVLLYTFCCYRLTSFHTGFEKFTDSTLDRSTYASLQDHFPKDWPHLVFLVLDSYFGTGSGQNPPDLDSTKQYAAASVGLTATFSRGNVSINSPDTANNPVISPNWLSDPRDLDMAVAAFQRGRQLFGANGLRSLVTGEVYPSGNVTTRDQIIEVIKESANSVYNAVGTNKMGQRNDSLAVVDSAARVIGVNGLRVVDASIFPFLPTSQPCATVCKYLQNVTPSEANSVLSFYRRTGGEDRSRHCTQPVGIWAVDSRKRKS